MSILGENLRACREAAGLTPYQLARRATVSEKTIRFIEAGKRSPRGGTVEELAFALGVTPARLLEDSPDTACCDVYRIEHSRVCRAMPAFPFAASCACGCLTCWREHQLWCPVTVTVAEAVPA